MNVRAARWLWWGGLLALLVFLPARSIPLGHAFDATTITVTSAGDSVVPGETECPSETLCTLRRAIELAHEEEEEPGGAITIVFDPTVFPEATPVAIEVADTPLPEITRADVHIDGSGAGVIVDGSLLEEADQPGVRFHGEDQSIHGVTIQHFTGTCLDSSGADFVAGGDPLEGHGLVIGDCTNAVVVGGDNSHVQGALIGVGDDLAVQTGIHVLASGAVIGVEGEIHPWPVTIGQAGTGIRIGGGLSLVENTAISGNTFGGASGIESEGPSVTYGIVIQAPARGSLITGITFANVIETAIIIGTPTEELPNDRHAITGNVYGSVGMAIDLNANGLREPNDVGDADTGANTLLNWPTITRATESLVQGNAGACTSCTVSIYRSTHAPGGFDDLPVNPVVTAITDSNGNFAAEVDDVEAGDWLMATVSDGDGNTSEFGPSERVGSGLVECGATHLVNGWNHAGFFGANGTPLGQAFPASGPDAGKVLAIYKLVDGGDTFLHWNAGMPFGNTLATLEPGEAYFFLVDGELSLPGGFELAVPYPVSLKAGWNDFVYIGAEGHYLDAFGDANVKITNTFRFADGDDGRWEQTGDADIPAWARDFTEIDACATYEIFATSAVTLQPMQP